MENNKMCSKCGRPPTKPKKGFFASAGILKLWTCNNPGCKWTRVAIFCGLCIKEMYATESIWKYAYTHPDSMGSKAKCFKCKNGVLVHVGYCKR